MGHQLRGRAIGCVKCLDTARNRNQFNSDIQRHNRLVVGSTPTCPATAEMKQIVYLIYLKNREQWVQVPTLRKSPYDENPHPNRNGEDAFDRFHHCTLIRSNSVQNEYHHAENSSLPHQRVPRVRKSQTIAYDSQRLREVIFVIRRPNGWSWMAEYADIIAIKNTVLSLSQQTAW